ncbi:MAG: glycosyltransferase family 25 protein [Syntrophotaleaceae bacterium]
MFQNAFDMIFIINLDDRPDKWDRMVERLKALGADNYERVSAIKRPLSEFPYTVYSGMSTKKLADDKIEQYCAGQSGCKMSHLKALKLARSRNYRAVLILEDDCEFLAGLAEAFPVAWQGLGTVDWDMFYLGGYHRSRRKARRFMPGLLNIRCTYQAHAYAVARQAFDAIIQKLEGSDKEVDVVYADDVHPFMNCYSLHPGVAVQEVGVSDIKQTLCDHRRYGKNRFIENRAITFLRNVVSGFKNRL